MKYDFAVIGANGIQGKIVSRTLLEDGYSVLLCANDDYKMEGLIDHPKADFAAIDLRFIDKVRRIVKKSGATVVVNCAVDDFNLGVTKMALDLGMNYVDLGSEDYMIFDQLALDKDFKERNIIGVTGMGSTPGITNVMLRHAKDKFDTIETVHVGFAWASNQKKFVTPFSIDAIAWEFTQKCKNFENGQYVEQQPYDCKIDYRYKSIGKQKTQYARHVEPVTFAEFLKDKGVKNVARLASFPEHSHDIITKLLELGFMSKNEINVGGATIKPLDFTTEVLRRIEIPQEYSEKENLFLRIFGTKNGKKKTMEMDCLAGTLPGWEEHTCNVDTGFPVAVAAEMILKNEIPEKGMFSPEFVMPVEAFFKELAQKGLYVYENGRKINGLEEVKQKSMVESLKEKIKSSVSLSPSIVR